MFTFDFFVFVSDQPSPFRRTFVAHVTNCNTSRKQAILYSIIWNRANHCIISKKIVLLNIIGICNIERWRHIFRKICLLMADISTRMIFAKLIVHVYFGAIHTNIHYKYIFPSFIFKQNIVYIIILYRLSMYMYLHMYT